MVSRHVVWIAGIVSAMLSPSALAQSGDASKIATQVVSAADEVIKIAKDAARYAADAQVHQTKLAKLDDVKRQMEDAKNQLNSGKDAIGAALTTDQRDSLNMTLRTKQSEYNLLLETSAQFVFAQAQHKLNCTILPQKTQQLSASLAEFKKLVDSSSAAQRRKLLDESPPLKALHTSFPKKLADVHEAIDNAHDNPVGCGIEVFKIDPWQEVNASLGSSVIINALKLSHQGVVNNAKTLVDAIHDFQEINTKNKQLVSDYNSAVKSFNTASVSAIDFTLNSSYEQQLIKEPPQPWEVSSGDILTMSGVGAGVLGNVLGLLIKPAPLASDQQSVGFFKDGRNYALIGTGLGLAAAAVGQALKTREIPAVVRESADRLAVNRLVGLSVQKMAYALALAKARFGNSGEIPEIKETVPYSESQEELAFRNTLVLHATRLNDKNFPNPLSAAEIAMLGENHVKWNDRVNEKANSLSVASSAVNAHMEAVKTKSKLLVAVIDTTSSALQELRDLLGTRATSVCAAASTSPVWYDCNMKSKSSPLAACQAGQVCASPTDYCNAYKATPGSQHFAAELLSDKGVNDLLRLASCNFKNAQSAQESARKGIDFLEKAQKATGELDSLLVKNVNGRVVEVKASMDRLARGD